MPTIAGHDASNEVLTPQTTQNRFWLPSQLHTWAADFKSSSGYLSARARSSQTVGNDNPEQIIIPTQINGRRFAPKLRDCCTGAIETARRAREVATGLRRRRHTVT